MDIKFNYDNNCKKKSKSVKQTKKIKHFNSIQRDIENAKCNKYISNKNNHIEEESFLLFPAVNSKHKSKVTLKEIMHPNDFNVNLKSKPITKNKNYTSYYGNHYGPGKGFGNTDINNIIRNGESSRIDKEKYNLKIESNLNDRRDILFKNYQDPNNLILPFPRGGEITRKSLKMDYNNTDSNFQEEFIFKY